MQFDPSIAPMFHVPQNHSQKKGNGKMYASRVMKATKELSIEHEQDILRALQTTGTWEAAAKALFKNHFALPDGASTGASASGMLKDFYEICWEHICNINKLRSIQKTICVREEGNMRIIFVNPSSERKPYKKWTPEEVKALITQVRAHWDEQNMGSKIKGELKLKHEPRSSSSYRTKWDNLKSDNRIRQEDILSSKEIHVTQDCRVRFLDPKDSVEEEMQNPFAPESLKRTRVVESLIDLESNHSKRPKSIRSSVGFLLNKTNESDLPKM